MEDSIETILQNKTTKFLYSDKPSSWLPCLASGITASIYAFWAVFVFPGIRKVPVSLRVDLSQYKNVTVFLAPNAMETLEKKLSAELPDDARVIVCRFPFPHWPHTCTEGASLDQVWAYDVMRLKGSLLHYRKQQPCT
ncbi:hypothetical protein XENTR_v10002914 [Xenopus tropicalis]|nr:hypothetical protein XENTR_v10002914 [Xenopus tropicalis]